MTNKIKLLAVAFLIFGLYSCGSTKDTTGKKPVASIDYEGMFATIDESDNPYQPSEERVSDIIHTKLSVDFNWDKSQMNGEAELTVKPHFYPSDSLILDAKSMDIHHVSIGGKKIESFSYDGFFLRIKLDKVYTRKDQYKIQIKYTAKPEDWVAGGSRAITSDKGLYFINPKGEQDNMMPQIWTQGETEASSLWFPTIDAPNEKTTQEIYMTVQDKFMTLSNGLLISSTKNANGTRTDYWKQELAHAPYLFMMAVGEFVTIHDSVTLKSGKKIEVDYIVEKEWEQSAKDIFGETPAMILFFSDLLGVEYPWDKYHQIIVREYVSGAMENTSAVIHGDYFYKTKRELLDEDDQSTVAHELFHHWFGDLVTCESWSNLPLNESFANYSQYLWDEHRHGIDHADYYAEDEESGYMRGAQYRGHHNLIWYHFEDKENMFDGHSYNKGGRILHMLRNYLGDEAFFESLRVYLSENAYQPAEVHQLRMAFEKVSGKDLNWFFNIWFFGKGHPDLNISHKVLGNEVVVQIDQTQDVDRFQLFNIPMNIEVISTKGTVTKEVWLTGKKNKFSFPINGELLNVKVDPDRVILSKRTEEKSFEQFKHQYLNKSSYRDRKDAVLSFIESNTSESREMILKAMNDPFWGIREIAIEGADVLFEEAHPKLKETLINLAEKDKKSAVRSLAIEYLAELYGNDADVKQTVGNALKDSSYYVMSSALYALGEFNTAEDLNKIKTYEGEKNTEILATIADIYAEYGSMSNKSFFVNTLKRSDISEDSKIGVMYSYTKFLAKQPVDRISTGISTYTDLAKSNKGEVRSSCSYALDNLRSAFERYIEVLDKKIVSFEADKKTADAMYAKNERVKTAELVKELSNAMEEIQMMDVNDLGK